MGLSVFGKQTIKHKYTAEHLNLDIGLYTVGATISGLCESNCFNCEIFIIFFFFFAAIHLTNDRRIANDTIIISFSFTICAVSSH